MKSNSSIKNMLLVVSLVLVVSISAFAITAESADAKVVEGKDVGDTFSFADGDKITSDMEISANYESTATDNSGIYNAILVIIVAVIAAAIILHVIYHKKK